MEFPSGLPQDVIEALRNPELGAINQHFGLSTPQEWMAKLVWNSDRLRAVPVGPHLERAFALMDFIVTAWHMHEWLFHSVDDDERTRWGDILGSRLKSEKDFGDKLREQFPELQACYSITNALKHAKRNKPDESGVYAWIASETHGVEVPDGRGAWIPKLFDGTVTNTDVEFTDRVLAFWTLVLAQLEILPEPLGSTVRARFDRNQRRVKYPYLGRSWSNIDEPFTMTWG